ncbi:MAG: enolase C-terminal domain-like protein [Verrucomicrobiota bacterium]|jgi:L-alanine-DL-glutamate epimerase-like enolase superfamily enzyme
MPSDTDIRVTSTELYFLPVQARIPLKFGHETLTSVICARVRMEVEDQTGTRAYGWGESPLSVQWVWPSPIAYADRLGILMDFCRTLAEAWTRLPHTGHPLELGHLFQRQPLHDLLEKFNLAGNGTEPMPWLAALACCAPFDIALHDAFGCLHKVNVYETYRADWMNHDLQWFLEPASDASKELFAGRYPSDYLVLDRPPRQLLAWHLVGGKDLLDDSERTGQEPEDGFPVTLTEWIAQDGLRCLKVKLTGTDPAWDLARLVDVGRIAYTMNCLWLSADFNCTVIEPAYVNAILDDLLRHHPRIYAMLLYVEQPFPYDLERYRIDVRSVVARKPLFMDESAHDWRMIRLGRALGWSGVALKTCKTQTGAILSLCWAKAHGMTVMVQDLTNPMLAQIPHLLLAAYADTIMGVETNSMQFYPEASAPEASVHPYLFRRRDGKVDLSSLGGGGFGYRQDEILRQLPDVDTFFSG